jgi:uncharacterized protein YjgD (DUF1641 family)
MNPKSFYNRMLMYLEEYKKYLLEQSNGTVTSHSDIIHEFINYLYNHHLVSGIDQITVSIANSKFFADFKRRNKKHISKDEMKNILNGFFTFLYAKYGIRNEKLMNGLEKSI